MQKKKKSKRLGYLMLLPALAVILLIQIYPFLDGFKLSFTNSNLLSPGKEKFIGLQNYIDILTKDKEFYSSLAFSFIYAISIVIFSYILGMLIAALLNMNMKGRGIYRAVILMPWVIAPMVMAANWLWLLNDQFGLINHVLMELKIIEKPILFLTTRYMSRFTVTMIGVWKNLPFMTITLLAGMQGIPGELYEAARIDGGGKIKSFLYITLPSLGNILFFCSITLTVDSWKLFNESYILPGPSTSNTSLFQYMYESGFNIFNMGYASAIGVILILILAVLSVMQMVVKRKQGEL